MVPDVNIGEEPPLDVVFVCSGLDYSLSEEKSALAWLRGLERKGTSIGAISSGAFNLAEAGMIEMLLIKNNLFCLNRKRKQ